MTNIRCGNANPRERVYQALMFQEPDICPYYVWISEEVKTALSTYYGNYSFDEEYITNHLVMREIVAARIPLDNDKFTDEFGTVWRNGNIPHIEKPALARASLAGYAFPDLSTHPHYEGISSWSDRYGDRFRVVQLGQMLFSRAWILRGFENLMVDLWESPSFVEELLDNIEQINNSIIDRLLRDHHDQIDAIGFDDDYGGQQSMLISPETWRHFVKPRLRRMYERVKKGGKYVYAHSCGCVTPIIPDLIEIGLNMLQPVQPESMDVYALKREFGRDLCLVGGISTQQTLPLGSPADVRSEVLERIELIGSGGGYVAAPAKPILPDVPIENAAALIDTIVSQASCR